jgi:hypothetical protein
MAMIDRSEFLWMFPCYILASNYTRTPDGDPIFDDKILLATPEIGPGQTPVVVMFTDSDAAHDFVDTAYENTQLNLLEIPDTKRLRRFLDVAVHHYRYLEMDLHPKTRRSSRRMLIADVLAHLEQDHH